MPSDTAPDSIPYPLPPRRYQPSWFILASGVLHALGFGFYFWKPEFWVQILLILVLNHVFLTLLGLWPKSTLLGPNMVRLPSHNQKTVYLTFDDGPDPIITPKVLDVLSQYDFKCTFFLIGEHVQKYPEIVREIVARGHAVANHSQSHAINFAMHSYRGYVDEIAASQRAIHDASGIWPRYFRAPFGFRSPILEPALCRTGLYLVSWTRRGFDTRCRSSEKILERLTRNLEAGDILLLHDGPFGVVNPDQPIVLNVLPQLIEIMREKGLTSQVLPDFGCDVPDLVVPLESSVDQNG